MPMVKGKDMPVHLLYNTGPLCSPNTHHRKHGALLSDRYRWPGASWLFTTADRRVTCIACLRRRVLKLRFLMEELESTANCLEAHEKTAHTILPARPLDSGGEASISATAQGENQMATVVPFPSASSDPCLEPAND